LAAPMIGLDTNVMIRFFTRDDPIQFEQARSFIETELSAEEPGYVNLIVLAEFVWTLARAYRYSKDEVVSAVDMLLDSAEIALEREEAVAAAISLCKAGDFDFVDALIAAINRDAGCRETWTFDARFANSNAAKLLGR
jgi:predicted nucleic-acid-binding protein